MYVLFKIFVTIKYCIYCHKYQNYNNCILTLEHYTYSCVTPFEFFDAGIDEI